MQKQRRNKFYEIDKSPLYKLANKRKLAGLLGVTTKKICSFIEEENGQYKVWIDKKGKKPRQIEAPENDLKIIQKRLSKFLSRIEPTDWIFSGIKKRSYILNAKSHINNSYFVKIDISNFYRSCDKEYIFRFFKYRLIEPDDIAWILTHITSFDAYVPTGAPTSQLIAFWACLPCFEEIVNIPPLSGQ